jgi:ABC-type multidrug transport system fused ATPase/permease subunit
MSDIIDDGFTENKGITLLQIEPRKKFLVISIILVLILRLFLAWAEHIQFGNYENYFAGDVDAAGKSENMGSIILNLAGMFFIAFILAIVAVCVWFYRANQNLHRANLDNIQHTSGWSVGWFFIPFANLVKPANVMSEIVKGTNKISGKFSTAAWQSQKTNSFVTLWWLCYIFSGFLSNISSRMFDEINLESNDYTVISGLEFASVFLNIISGIMLINIVLRVTAEHEKNRLLEID